MTERQEKVLNYIIEKGKVGIKELGRECGFNVKETNNHDCCVVLRSEINKINSQKDHAYTIVWDKDYNYWVAETEQEREMFMQYKKLNPALKKLKTYWASRSKASLDNQVRYDDEFINFVLKGIKEV